MAGHKYAVFYPEHTGFLHVKKLGTDASADLLWGIRDGKTYARRKYWPETYNSTAVPALDGSQYYREVAGIPKLVHAQSYQHLVEESSSHELFRSHALICEYCNGGNLSSFLERLEHHYAPVVSAFSQIESHETLEIFIWHYFDSILQVFGRLHAQGICYFKNWHVNHFLHFHEGAKLPEIRLGNLDMLTALTLNGLEHELAGLFYNITHLMDRKWYNVDELEYDISLKNDEGFSKELLKCRQTLGQMCMTQLKGNYSVENVDIEPCLAIDALDLTPKLKQVDELAATVASMAKRARAKAKNRLSLDLSGIRRDKPGVVPTLFDTRKELLKTSLGGHPRDKVSGPWRIAHVDPTTFKVLAVERTDFNLHDPQIGPCGSSLIPHELADELKRTPLQGLIKGWDIFKLAELQDKATDKKWNHVYFVVDPEWTEARLYSQKDPCQACHVREEAMSELLAGRDMSRFLPVIPSEMKQGSRKRKAESSKKGAKGIFDGFPIKTEAMKTFEEAYASFLEDERKEAGAKKQAKGAGVGTGRARKSRRLERKSPENAGL
ncbi:hypothetical protein H2200_006365 [Cladophialophora chaetospira]|uniref:Protein kinase domain-containing protein n=1 Tax=Cladophialophora chaetospira TaxID=386627 RepID=A0AA39CJ77_9EURO|nr:hypothetical protein H2200_006365 [Cladophialophora chaetospira]